MNNATVKIQIGTKYIGKDGELVNEQDAIVFPREDVSKPNWKRYLRSMARDYGRARLVPNN